MKEGESLRSMSAALTIDKMSFVRSLHNEGSPDWETIKNVIDHLGYELKFVHVTLSPAIALSNGKNIVHFPVSRKAA